jgi:hypothetical protein
MHIARWLGRGDIWQYVSGKELRVNVTCGGRFGLREDPRAIKIQ